MNLLTGKLPESITIQGAEYPIKTDYRIFIELEIIVSTEEITEETIKKIFDLCFEKENIPPLENESIDALLDFYAGGKAEDIKGSTTEKPYYFNHDDAYIYSAFLDQYNIDLQEVEYMHWWKFRSLFISLKEDNEISKIMGYRTFKPDSNTPVETSRFIARMKELYKPPESSSEREERKRFNDFIRGGGKAL